MVIRKNLFDGESYKAEFAIITYRWLMSRRWVTNADIMAERLGCSVEELPANLSNCDGYGELKKIVCIVKKAIRDKLGISNKSVEDCFEEDGNNKNKRFRYIGEDNDPLADMRNAKVINNLRQYWKFCQDSAGFFPKSWLEYFFKDCQDLLDMKAKRQKGEQVISASIDRILTNIEYLPSLYEAITNKNVQEIDYKPFDEEIVTLMFHPHYLKEYNGRWHLFGHADGKEPEFGYNIALDRIQSKPRERSKIEYLPAPKHFYDDFFKDIVGTSHEADAVVKSIIVRARTNYMFNLIKTKPIHGSQVVVKPFGKHDDGEYGEFELTIEVNNEFMGRVLQMGDGLEVMSPPEVRERFAERVKNMMEMYKQ